MTKKHVTYDITLRLSFSQEDDEAGKSYADGTAKQIAYLYNFEDVFYESFPGVAIHRTDPDSMRVLNVKRYTRKVKA